MSGSLYCVPTFSLPPPLSISFTRISSFSHALKVTYGAFRPTFVPVFFPVSGFTAFGRSRMSFVAFSAACSIALRKAIVSRPTGW